MRRRNSHAVSNILGFVFSFSILSLIMSFSVLTTISIIDAKSHEAASVEAQNLANQIADAMVNAITISQSMPNAEYHDYFEFPETLAGFEYYITIENNIISVKTMDGEIQKSCPMYNTNYLAFNIEESIGGGQEGISIAYSPPEFIYKIDCGKKLAYPYSESHSKVKSGYSYVTEMSVYDPLLREPAWHDGRDAEPSEGVYGGLCAVDDNGEAYIFFDDDFPGGTWRFELENDILLNVDFDDDGLIANVGDHQGGLYAFDDTIPGGEPYLFIDNNGDWIFDPLTETAFEDDPDGDEILADLSGGNEGGLCAIDPNGEPFVFKDNSIPPDSKYTTAQAPNDEVLYFNPDWHYNHQYRIPIKLDNTDGPTINHPIRIVLSSQDIAINELCYWYQSTIYSNGIFYDPDIEKELKHSLEYIKSYDADNPDWYFGASDLIKENIIFYVNVTIPPDSIKYIYFYYGSDEYFANDIALTSDFYDDFKDTYSNFDRIYAHGENVDDVLYSICRDNWDFIYAVGSHTDDAGNVDWWLKQFDVNGYEYDQEAVFGSTDPGWNKTYGGGGDDRALATAFSYETDPSVYVVGYFTSNLGDKNWWLKKFSRNGAEDLVNWNLNFDNTGGDDVATAVAIAGASYYEPEHVYVAGYTTDGGDTDWWIKNFNLDGVEDGAWNKILGGAGNDEVTDIAIDIKNKVYVVGYTTNANKDWWIKKYNSDGTEAIPVWDKTINWGSDDIATGVETDVNGDVYVIGTKTNGDGNTDWVIKKFNEEGTERWEELVGGEGNQDDIIHTIFIDNTDNTDDWSYTPGEELELDIDGDWILASPDTTDRGYLYAFDAANEPYLFKDTNPKWEYNGEEVANYDPDGNGADAIPEDDQQAGLYALDSDGKAYFFQDTITRDWEWTSGEDDYPIDVGVNPQEGDKGGLYAITEEEQHYTFVDMNFVYVAGDAVNEQGLKTMRVIKYYPSGEERWDKTYLYPGDGDSSCSSLTIDSEGVVYLAGTGTDFEGSATGDDWWIKKIGSSGLNYFSRAKISPEKWSMSYVRYLSNLFNPGIDSCRLTSYGITTHYNHYILTKDYAFSLGNDDLYQIDVKLKTNSSRKTPDDNNDWNSQCHSGIVLLSQDGKVNYHLPAIQDTVDAYLIELQDKLDGSNNPDATDFSIVKREEGVITATELLEIPYVLAGQSAGEGFIVRIYLYKNDVGQTVVTSRLYHPSTAAPYETVQVYTDESGSPYLSNGRIGLVNFYETSNQNIYCDSIRVLKTIKNTPEVFIGVPESINFGWEWDGAGGTAGEQSTVFCLDPLLYDYVEIPIETGDENIFILGKLPSDTYQASLTIGESTDHCTLYYGFREEGDSFSFSCSIDLPETGADEFTRVWFTQEVQVPEESFGEIGLKFVGNSATKKKISSITIEKVEQYVGFESVPD